MSMNRTLRLAGLLSLCGLALSGACSTGGDAAPENEETARPTAAPAEVIQVDPATALRLRRLADASVAAAVRTFGPAEGLPLDELGARLFRTRGCIECHGPGVSDPIGPDLIDAFGTMRAVEGRPPILMDLDYINVALMRPDALVAAGYQPGTMPSYDGTLYPREVLALAVYLQGMSSEPRVPSGGPAGAGGDQAGDAVELPPSSTVRRVDAPLIPLAEPDDGESPSEQRSDGRPDWWFDGIRREDGRVWICAEALGNTFGAARTATIERGQAMLADQMGIAQSESLEDLRVRFIWVTPLPNRGVEQRYAGYVMMSAIAEAD
jgi:mono/diheme cytochrome c family protein